jgi:hypothetical protein
MAKRVHSVQLKGVLTNANMEITETTKEAVNTYDLAALLEMFEGRQVTISVKEEEEIEPKDEE